MQVPASLLRMQQCENWPRFSRWVAIITLFVLAEKVLPWGPKMVRAASGLLLVASGILVLAG